MLNVVSQKFYNQLRNGEDFSLNLSDYTTNLYGTVQGRYKAIFEVEVFWYSQADTANQFVFSGNKITRLYGSFLTDQWSIGDTCIISATGGGNDGTRTVTNVTPLELTLNGAAFITHTSDLALLTGATELTGIDFKYGLIENSESTNFLSKIDGSTQGFTASGVGVAGATTEIAATAKGMVNSWKHGSASFAYVSTTANRRKYRIEHEFIMLPYYLDGDQDNIEDLVPIEVFEPGKALKYVFDFRAAITTTNPSTYKGGVYDGEPGVNFWLNGTQVPNIFSISNVSFTNTEDNGSVDSLQSNKRTKVVFDVDASSAVFSSSSKFIVQHSYLPAQADYRGGAAASRTLEENFLFESKLQTVGAAAVDATIMDGIFAVLVSTSKIRVTLYVDYSSSQQAMLDDTKNYLISITTGLPTTYVDSLAVNLKVNYDLYTEDTDGAALFGVEDFNILQHSEQDDPDDTEAGHTSIGAYVEDKVLSRFKFWLDLDESALIKQLAMRVVAYNPSTGDFFELQSTTLDMANFVVSSGVQQIYVDQTRGFLLVDDSIFNYVFIEPTELVGSKQYYQVKWAFAFNWEDYRALLEANGIFFDNTKLNNGLNYLTSNYSDLNGYDIRLFIESTVNDGSVDTEFRAISPVIKVFEYDTDENDTPDYSTLKEFRNEAGDLIGSNILTNERTTVKITFQNDIEDIGTLDWGKILLEEYRNGGLFRIHEISTRELRASNNPLIPLDGEDYCIMTLVSPRVVTLECRIDNNLIEKGRQYHISGRFAETPIPTPPDTKYFEEGDAFVFEDGSAYEFE